LGVLGGHHGCRKHHHRDCEPQNPFMDAFLGSWRESADSLENPQTQ
jgi:hypothetical protein